MTTLTAPTGVHLGNLVPGTPEWDAARRGECITATEIAAVVGLSPWMSRFTLWHKKAGLPTPRFETNPAMEWGTRLEDAIAEKWAEEHMDATDIVSAGTWAHRDRPWQRATPDFMYTPLVGWMVAPGTVPELLEIKTSPTGDSWENGVPVYYRCQIQWQLDTLGLPRCWVALLVGGHDYREYVVDYDPDEAALLRDAAQAFLHDVRHGVRPPIDSATDTYQTIRAQFTERDDIEVQIPAELADRYEAAGAAQKAAEADRRQAAAEVLDAIGTGRWAIDPTGRRVAQRTTANSLTPCKKKGDSL